MKVKRIIFCKIKTDRKINQIEFFKKKKEKKKLQNKFGGLEIKFYLCTRFESRAANFRERGFSEQGAHGTKRK